MQVSQEQPGGQDRQRNRYQQMEHDLQEYIYQHAEYRAGRKWRWILDYLSILPILALTMLLTVLLQHIVNDFAVPAGFLVLAFSITALWWGWGPGLLLLLLGLLILDFFFLTPYKWDLLTWPNILQVLPFVLVCLVIGFLSLQRDKGWRETRAYARMLAEEAQLKARLVSMTAHELKTPVTGILMQSQLLQRRLKKQSLMKETESALQSLEKINECVQFLTAMINELVDLSRVERHQMTLDRQLQDMNRLCQEAVESQRFVTGRSILFQGSATPALIEGDHNRLIQVLNNLLGNAIKYSPASSSIQISVHHDAQHVIIQVRDYGQGIEQDEICRIFDAFYRTVEAQSGAEPGLGLGLAITKQILDLHEGRIWCASEKGCGCTFFVELPTKTESK